eukprot:483118-Prorocentrum_minimum.AAC.1
MRNSVMTCNRPRTRNSSPQTAWRIGRRQLARSEEGAPLEPIGVDVAHPSRHSEKNKSLWVTRATGSPGPTAPLEPMSDAASAA